MGFIQVKDKEVYSYIASIEPCCQLCGSMRMLNMHHINYGCHERDTYIGNVIVLCNDCHRMVHRDKKTWQQYLVDLDKEIRGDYECK